MSKLIEEQSPLQSPNVLGMILSPRKQFKLMINTPLILKPLLIVSFITILAGIILFQGIDFGDEPFLNSLTTRELFDLQAYNIMNSVLIVIATMIAYALIHFLAAKVVKSKISIIQLISMNAHIAIIPAIGILINSILFYFMKDMVSVSSFTTLGNLVNNSDVLKAALSSFELFLIWQFVLMALGLQVVGRFTKKSAWVIIMLFFFMLVSLEIAVAVSGLN